MSELLLTGSTWSTSKFCQLVVSLVMSNNREPFVPVDELIPVCGFLCCLHSLVCKQPSCEGCYTKDVCCCLYHEIICCKPSKEPGFDKICYRMECMQGECTTCRQSEWQCLCYDFRCSATQIPEQPCICTALFFTCYFDNQRACSCCEDVHRLKEIINRTETRSSNLHQIMENQLNDDVPHRPNPAATRSPGNPASTRSPDNSARSTYAPPVATPRGNSATQLPEATVVYDP